MRTSVFSRRQFLKVASLASGSAVLAACQPKVVEKVVTKEVEKVVTKEVEKVIKETIIVQGTPKVIEKVVTNTPAPKGKIKVSFMVPGTPTEDADFAPVFEAFNKMYPDIEGVYAPAGTGYGAKYRDKVITMLAGGVLPDVFKSLADFFGSLAAMGAYLPLDDYIAAEPEITYFDDFFDAHVEACKYQGEMLALPNDGAPNGMWYNCDMFDADNVAYPDWDTTWDDLLEKGKTLTKVEGDITTQHGIGRPHWRSFLWSNGGQELSEDGKRSMLDQPEAIEAFQFMQDLVVKYKVCPGPEALAELAQGERFQTGRLGTVFGTRGWLGGLRSIEDFFFDAAPMVKSNKGTRLTQLAIGYTSIWKGSKHPDEAYKLTAWICSPEGQRLRISRGFAHPSRKSLVEQEWYRTYQCDKCKTYAVNTVFPEMLLRGEAKALPPHPKRAEIEQTTSTALDSLWDGSKPAEQVCQELAEEINKIVSR